VVIFVAFVATIVTPISVAHVEVNTVFATVNVPVLTVVVIED
ncbi:21232_t:CDS:1, partial [Entrophospora sp. SA101]